MYSLFDSDSDSDSFDNERVEVAAGGGDSDYNSEASIDEDEEYCKFDLQEISNATGLVGKGEYACIQNITDDGWEGLGRDISNSFDMEALCLYEGALDDHKVSLLFRGLTRGNSIAVLRLNENGLSAAGVRSMVPFLQNASYLRELNLDNNNIKSEGFNMLFRALSNGPLEELNCISCGIDSIDIDSERLPTNLIKLCLGRNTINTDGCRGLAKLLQGEDSTLATLYLGDNAIDDDGVEILVDALQRNASLKTLNLMGNDGISKQAQIMLLKLVNDISSIKATLQSNHTLQRIMADYRGDDQDLNEQIQRHIDNALRINALIAYSSRSLPEEAGREKMIQTQLSSGRRADLVNLQGVNHSLYSEINPLHLPEVLALIGRRHGQGELYVALRSSIAGVISTVNRKQCLQQQRAYFRAKIAEYRAKAEEVEAEISTIEAAEGHVVDIENESYSNKRRRA
mmetsp:Transcript_34445/g.50725  ORF Transcript_34445/g.50725 Transcript_34445/m.50725 type:complete len:457 (-) Transcript_34445:66-1436(-)